LRGLLAIWSIARIKNKEVLKMAEKSLAERIQRLEDVHEISNLVNRYESKLVGGLYDDVVEMFAQKTPGVRAELINSGVYENAEGIKKLYGKGGVHEMLQGSSEKGMIPGIMFSQANMHPIIEVAGDGKTAKGLFLTSGHKTVPIDGKPKAFWLWTKRAYDFVKEDGEWKIWHYHVYGVFCCPYDKSWADLEDPDVGMGFNKALLPENLGPDKPITYHWHYSPTRAMEYIPKAPESYETFDETFSY
jgi:hypothetical protein